MRVPLDLYSATITKTYYKVTPTSYKVHSGAAEAHFCFVCPYFDQELPQESANFQAV